MKKVRVFMAALLALLLVPAAGLQSVLAEEAEVPVVFAENFDAFADDAAAAEALEKAWSITGPLKLEEAEAGKALRLDWWELASRQMILDKAYVPNAYEMSFALKGGTGSHDGCFVFLRTNAKQAKFPLFEADGCTTDGLANGVGDAGIYIKPHGAKLHIGVKTAEPVDDAHAQGIGNLRYVVDLPAGKDFGFHYLRFRIVDQDHVVSIYMEDALVATIAYSDIQDGYYTKAVIKKADGETAGQTETARIAALENTPALVVRGGYMSIDDFSVKSLTGTAPALLPEVMLYDTAAGRGNPAGLTGDAELAMKITVEPGKAMKSITFKEMPTFDGFQTKFTFSVYRWDTDYAATLQGTPVYQTEKYDHANCVDCIFGFPEPLSAGTYLFVISDGKAGVDAGGAAGGHPGVWTASKAADPAVTVFSNGTEADFAIYASMTLLDGYPVIADPTNPEPPVTENPPETGEAGLSVFVFAFLLLTASAAILLAGNRKRCRR